MYNNCCDMSVCADQDCLAGLGRTSLGLRRTRPHPSMVPSKFIPAGDKLIGCSIHADRSRSRNCGGGSPVSGFEDSTPELLAAKASPGPAAAYMSRPDSRSPRSTWPPDLQYLHRDTVSVPRVSHSVGTRQPDSPRPTARTAKTSRERTRVRYRSVSGGSGHAVLIRPRICASFRLIRKDAASQGFDCLSHSAGLPAVNRALVINDTVAVVINHREAKDLQIG